jgi:hypothetical protein
MTVKFRLHSTNYQITRVAVLQVAKTNEPKRITKYYVEINGKSFPVTQLVRLAAKTVSNPHPANSRSILIQLGFVVKSR